MSELEGFLLLGSFWLASALAIALLHRLPIGKSLSIAGDCVFVIWAVARLVSFLRRAVS